MVQGLTEFLPVSSSGHLVLLQHWFGFKEGADSLTLDVALHFGTLVAVVYYYRNDLIQMALMKSPAARRLIVLLFLATLPSVIVGLFFKRQVEVMFVSPLANGFELIFTGCVLLLTFWLDGGDTTESDASYLSAFLIGIAQAVAILPGVSRSGMTIAVALFLAYSRSFSARFSFLMSIPAILGAVVLQSPDIAHVTSSSIPPLVLGTVVSGIVGFLSIRWLLGVISRGRLHYFAYYCWAVGALAIWAG